MKKQQMYSKMANACSSKTILLVGSIFMSIAIVGSISAATPKDILDGYVAATGGKPAYEKVQTRLTINKVSIKGTGIAIKVTTYQAKPDKAYIITESPASGKMESGCNGEVVWQNSAITGPQLKQGPEAADLKNAAVLDRLVYWQAAYQDVTFAGEEQVDGAPCYKLIAKPKGDGNAQTLFFDKQKKLMIKLTAKVQNAMGVIPVESYFSDYRAVDGILIPHKVRTVLPQLGREMQSEIVSCENNVKMTEDYLKLPPEIKALQER